MNPNSLDELTRVLNSEITPSGRKARWNAEKRKNRGTEWKCILACDAGEFLTELALQNEGLSSGEMFAYGIMGGITLGGLYAVGHTTLHGLKHSVANGAKTVKEKVSKLYRYGVEGLKYALVTEIGCVVAATTTEGLFGLAGNTLTSTNDVTSPENLLLRAIALPFTFYIGIRAMSGLTLINKKEAYRWVSDKGALPEVRGVINRHSPGKAALAFEESRMVVDGAGHELWIREQKIPLHERGRFDPKKQSLYIARSDVVPYVPDARGAIRRVIKESFADADKPVTSLENIFAHEH